MPRVSAKTVQRAELAAEKARAKKGTGKSRDSFQNLVAKIGLGTDNLSSAGTYGFNPITRERTLLEWIHRGSWVAGLAVDIIPDDMTRNGVDIFGAEADEIDQIQQLAEVLNIWGALRDNAAWGRLYGGSIAVLLVDGQDYATPLRVETIGKGQFKGIIALDRWQVQPSIEDLITEPGPQMGRPKYYTVTNQSPGLRNMKIHWTRCLRMDGNRLPYWQSITENLWSESVLERVYDRLLAFDSTTAGAAQLVYKSYLRTYAIKNLRELVAAGGDAIAGVASYVAMMAKFQSIEGVTLIDGEDKLEVMQHSAFSGLADVLIHFGQQISGAIQIPLVRLFGQSPAGLNSTGESDLKTYYENVANQQNREMKLGVTLIYRCLARSLGIIPQPGFAITFRPLWLLTESDRANIAQTITSTIAAGVELGVSQQTALEELKDSARVTGIWGHIPQEDIDAAEGLQPPMAEEVQLLKNEGGVEKEEAGDDPNEDPTGEPDEAKGEPRTPPPPKKEAAADKRSNGSVQ